MHASQGLVRSFIKISFRRRAGKSGFAHLHRGTKSPSLLARMRRTRPPSRVRVETFMVAGVLRFFLVAPGLQAG